MKGKITLWAAVAALSIAAGAARADEFQSLNAVSAAELSQQHGTDGASGCLALGLAVAQTCATMVGIVVAPGGLGSSGSSTVNDSMNNNKFSINAINTGNGAVMQNQFLIAITLH